MERCPGCSGRGKRHPDFPHLDLLQCRKCGGIYTSRPIYLGDSYLVVSPYMTRETIPVDRIRYFDLQTLGSQGLGRRHGWYDPATRAIVQVG